MDKYMSELEDSLEKLRTGYLFDTTDVIDLFTLVISERDALRARAEAAEALAYERLENALFAEQRANDTEAERDGLAARVAELEAATAWRQVTEDWPPYDVQHLGRATLKSPVILVTRRVHYEAPNHTWYVWEDSDGLLFYAGEIRYCVSIPPLPQEAAP